MSAPVRIFLVFSLGFFVSYLYRGVNLPAAPFLMSELGLSAADLGFLTSLYFLAFAGCQLPLGILLDRYGPRRTEAALLVVAGAGAILSALASSLALLMVGRFLIGLGVASCLMAAIKALVVTFPRERLPLLTGGVFALGGLGAVATGTPFEWALGFTDWRGLYLGLAALTFATVALLLIAVPERNTPGGADAGLARSWRGIVEILRSRYFWRIAPTATLNQGIFLAVQSLWAGPYLRDVAGADAATAARLVAIIGLAMVAGSLVLGWLARELDGRGIPVDATTGAGLLVFLLVQVAIVGGVDLPPALLWGLLGFFGSAGILAYAVMAQAFPAQLAGRVNTTLTLLCFAAAFLFQFGFGAILALWPAAAGAYPPIAYRTAWGIALVLQAASLVWFCLPAARPLAEPAE